MIKNTNCKIKTETKNLKNNSKTTYYYHTLNITKLLIFKSNIIWLQRFETKVI